MRPVCADDPAHGSQRRRDPRQRRFPDETDRSAECRRHRADRRGRRQSERRTRRPFEDIDAAGSRTMLRGGARLVYGGSLLISVVALGGALNALIAAPDPTSLVLPLGIPWIGAHFRV